MTYLLRSVFSELLLCLLFEVLFFFPLDLNFLLARLSSLLLTEVYEDDLLNGERSLYLLRECDLDDGDLDLECELARLRDLVYDLE